MVERSPARIGNYERDWRLIEWLVVETAVIEPLLIMKAGSVPCAVLPHGFIGLGREFVFSGMMLHIAERWPEIANPLSVFHAPTPKQRGLALPSGLERDNIPPVSKPNDDELPDRLIKWGR